MKNLTLVRLLYKQALEIVLRQRMTIRKKELAKKEMATFVDSIAIMKSK